MFAHLHTLVNLKNRVILIGNNNVGHYVIGFLILLQVCRSLIHVPSSFLKTI